MSVSYLGRSSRDWHAGVSQAQQVLVIATREQAQQVWDRARLEITGPEDHYGLGFTACLGFALDEEGVG